MGGGTRDHKGSIGIVKGIWPLMFRILRALFCHPFLSSPITRANRCSTFGIETK